MSDAGPRDHARAELGAGGLRGAAPTEARQARRSMPQAVYRPAPVDEVDRIVAAWRRERPDLDVSPLTVLSRISRLARHLDLARRSAFARHGLETWAFDVLSALRREGAPFRLSPGALLTQTLVTSGTMTNRIDRLAEHGLVERLPSPDDRRGVLVQLTPAGLRTVDDAMADLLAVERELLGDLPEPDRDRLAELLRTVVAPFDAS